jgi:hypothetical protein
MQPGTGPEEMGLCSFCFCEAKKAHIAAPAWWWPMRYDWECILAAECKGSPVS